MSVIRRENVAFIEKIPEESNVEIRNKKDKVQHICFYVDFDFSTNH